MIIINAIENLTAARRTNLTEQYDFRARIKILEDQLTRIEGGIMALTQMNQAAMPEATSQTADEQSQ